MQMKLRFRLKTFLLFVLTASVAFAYVGKNETEYRHEQHAIHQIQRSVSDSKGRPLVVLKSNFVPDKFALW